LKNCFGIISVLLSLTLLTASLAGVENEKPRVSMSFDDGSIRDYPGYSGNYWNELLLENLKSNNLKAILYVKGVALDNNKGKQIIKSWDSAGHMIGNHTYSHANFNNNDVSLEDYKREFRINDSLINQYTNYAKLFRFPYLKEGNTIPKRDGFRLFLKEQAYSIGYVTIDASDWYIDSRLAKRLSEDSIADISGFRDFYIEHLFDRAQYYDSLAQVVLGRKISHNLLLHHNLASALFLDDLIQYFRDNGWDVIDASEAYKDDVYKELPDILPAGESLIWALAKLSGRYSDALRYPAEDSRYEKAKMDSLGL